MKQFFKRSLLVISLFSPAAMAAVDSDNDTCNSSEGLEGWAVWCGVDSYLTQQELTAAGPVLGGAGLASVGIDNDGFGGKVIPPVTPEEAAIEYNWKGYAVLSHQDLGELESGVISLRIDPATGLVEGVMVTSAGKTIVLNKDAEFFAGESVLDGNGFFVASEDGKFGLLTFDIGYFIRQDAEVFEKTISLLLSESVSTNALIGGFGGSLAGGAAGGTLTPLADMANLASLNRVAIYSGQGLYATSNGYSNMMNNDMRVEFGTGSWTGNWTGNQTDNQNSSLGLAASGIVTGNQFSSTSITDNGNYAEVALPVVNVTGSINGSFNGSNASSLSGGLDINYRGQKVVGAFIATQGKNLDK